MNMLALPAVMTWALAVSDMGLNWSHKMDAKLDAA
jgi:hypothetical protein